MNKSESIVNLSKALVAFQAKGLSVKKEAKNPFYGNKYASLSQIIEAIQLPLAECGLAILQLPIGSNQLETTLIHESGEFISEVYEMKPSKSDPQGIGSAITYQRRYALGAILCLNIDEDDDGNKASAPEMKVKPTANEVNASKKKISDKAFSQLCDKLRAITEPVERGNLLAKTRAYYLPLDSEQENIISQITDN